MLRLTSLGLPFGLGGGREPMFQRNSVSLGLAVAFAVAVGCNRASQAAEAPPAVTPGSQLATLLAPKSQRPPPLVCDAETLGALDAAQLRVFRNFVFARYGRAFKSADLKALFGGLAWYRVDPGYRDSRLSAADKVCIEATSAQEEKAKAAPGAAAQPGGASATKRGRDSYPVRLLGAEGYLDTKGVLVIDRVGKPFSEGLAAIGGSNRKYGYMDTRGTMVIKPAYADARPFSEGFAAVRVGKRWGYVDRTGRWLVKPRFQDAWEFSDGMARVWRDGEWAYVDTSGAVTIEANCPVDPCPVMWNGPDPRVWESACRKDGYVEIKLGPDHPLWVKADPDLGYVLSPGCTESRSFSEGLAAVKRDGRWGFIDKRGAMVIAARYEDVGDFHEGWAWAFDPARPAAARHYYIDRGGQPALRPPMEVDHLGSFNEGLAPFRDSEAFAWGFLDRQGRVVVAPRFEKVKQLECALAAVKIRGENWTLINRKGELLAPPRFQEAPRCHNGLGELRMREGGRTLTYWMDRTGAYVGGTPDLR